MIGWIWFAVCQLFATIILFPLGLAIVGSACWLRDWTLTPNVTSIKPLPGRSRVDAWDLKWMNPFWGNPEDGVTGLYARGGSWVGAFNPAPPSRWRAFVWCGLRNWANGFAYLTWRWETLAPNLQLAYTVPAWMPRMGGTKRMLRLGWQQLPAADGWVGPYRCRMVCSF